MSKTTPDLGKAYPVGHSSGRVWPPPASIEQAKARVVYQMDHLEENCHIGLDVGYAVKCLDEAIEDYYAVTLGK